jgi:hypothetical protein
LKVWEGRGGEGEERRGEERGRHTTRGRSRSPAAGRCPSTTGTTVAYATLDLLLKYLDKIFATYV